MFVLCASRMRLTEKEGPFFKLTSEIGKRLRGKKERLINWGGSRWNLSIYLGQSFLVSKCGTVSIVGMEITSNSFGRFSLPMI